MVGIFASPRLFSGAASRWYFRSATDSSARSLTMGERNIMPTSRIQTAAILAGLKPGEDVPDDEGHEYYHEGDVSRAPLQDDQVEKIEPP